MFFVFLAKLFLRFSVASAMLSAALDRLGVWRKDLSFWGDMKSFFDYTHSLMPWVPMSFIPFLAWSATILEIVFSIFIILGYQLKVFSVLSGILLLLIALATVSTMGFKAVFDYSVFNASAAAFAIACLPLGYLELDFLTKKRR
ncbi:hypothetical protein BKH43_00895 [Helicobacter sp. 13S00401-1]|uniref:DoxX family membrane protein n=1 Tax=Helicobacter sp. 13S00401-1 TaxID=1905758 RepID=UPI000BA62A38|nr:DoxX family membrane protein [Helicobacter sp. 13S00401-1]PAF51822.1 hypothetical protein BKH43_00895 [Helicobacter sp. 13S00401-1]